MIIKNLTQIFGLGIFAGSCFTLFGLAAGTQFLGFRLLWVICSCIIAGAIAIFYEKLKRCQDVPTESN